MLLWLRVMTTSRALAFLLALATAGCGDDDPVSEPVVAEQPGCDGAALLEKPADYASAGPWPVGARVVSVDGLAAEVWYPAAPGSAEGLAQKRYDIRAWLPESERDKIPDAENPWQTCDCVADLPLDTARGPYPIVVFVHGTAGWRTQSLPLVTHWASRGFVVVAADHPGLYLADALDLKLQRDLAGDLAKLVPAVGGASGDLAFLAGHVDATRLGMVGHSAGGQAVSNQGSTSGVRVIESLAAGGVEAGSSLESSLIMGGTADAVAEYSNQVAGYEASPPKKRLIGIAGAGHLFPTDLCWLENAAGQDILEVAQQYQVKNASLAGVLFDCPTSEPPRETTLAISRFGTAAVLEETLHCDDADPFAGFLERFPEVSELRQEP